MARKPQATPQRSSGIIWLITGILLGVFISALIFLKKHVTIVENGQQAESIAVSNNAKPAEQPAAVATHKTAKAAHAKTATPDSNDQYDFYTMLPKMQVDQTQQTATNTPPTTSTAPPAKPTKPLALAEQSMLTPQKSPPVAATTPAQAAPARTIPAAAPAPVPTMPEATTQTTTPASAPAPAVNPVTSTPAPSKPSSYLLVVGNFSEFDKADARKAELLMAGMSNAKIEHYSKNDKTWYRVTLGSYPSKPQAQKALQQLQENQFTGTIQEGS